MPKDLITTCLFYMSASVEAMSTDNNLYSIKLNAVLVDRGTQGNTVPTHVVKTLRSRTIPTKAVCEVASGNKITFPAIVQLIVLIARLIRVLLLLQ